ncbi:MAG TPA: ABC transporter permease [Acidimicrobiia bacterium]|nr:ABC transporter permease [Acidimicrobiia bacterium]
MARYILKRIALGVLTLFLFVTALFFLINVLMPGDFMTQFRLGTSPAERGEIASQLGVDQPLWRQYEDWVAGLATGNLGTSFGGPSVASLVGVALPTSLLVLFAGMLIAFPLGNWLGRVGAWKGRGAFLGTSTLLAVVFFTVFPPSLAFLLERALRNATPPETFVGVTTLESGKWRLPDLWGDLQGDPGIPTPSDVLWRLVLALVLVLIVVLIIDRVIRWRRGRGLPLVALMGLLLGGPWLLWAVFGWRSGAVDLLGVLLLLIVGVVLLFYGEIQLVTEAAMEDVVNADFVTTARAKGLAERHIRDRHAARAALLPVLSRLVVSIPYFLSGLAILEKVFDVPGGLGNLIFDAIRNQDTAVVVGALVVVGVLSLAARLVMDVLYAVLDPRIRYRSGRLEVGVD